MRGAADLLGALPDNLREMAPRMEVGHVWRVFTEVAGREELKLVVVPAIAGCPGNRHGLRGSLGVAAGTPHGKVLTVAAAAN